eukprot:gnl/MRDRNA2_/MRDRNA2_81204_c0_seq5.p1 gnl/MRDRNA2_/MRDRNA2_81204_c0~~gnl/MRDRNA2_/MRDRNA2_81204_c0_seq5.p1  ORF type:complete len:154 (-),score=42.25 gnl/MRDRNA2_/MRDRNA2_81204_c0_seq5:64-525(-)
MLLFHVVGILLGGWQAVAVEEFTCAARPTANEHPECAIRRAYSVKTPEDSVNLYRDWADTYESGWARRKGYVMPERIAKLFNTLVAAGIPPTGRGTALDIGAGTGLVGEHLEGEVDAIDISAEMLKKAEEKGLYRKRIVADLTKPLDMIPSAT